MAEVGWEAVRGNILTNVCQMATVGWEAVRGNIMTNV